MVTEFSLFKHFHRTFTNYPVGDSHDAHVDRQEVMKSRFMIAALEGPVYVRLDGSARDGTIGRVEFDKELANKLLTREEFKVALTTLSEKELIANSMILLEWDIERQTRYVERSYTYEEYIGKNSYRLRDFNLIMDDGKVVKPATFSYEGDEPDLRSFTWLDGYTGPSVNKFSKNRKPKVEPSKFFDTYGHPVAIGDLVAVSVDGRIMAGVVDRFSASGETVYVKVDGGSKVYSWSNKVMVIDSKIKTRAMMDKLKKE